MFSVINDSIYISFSEEELSTLVGCLENSGTTGLDADLLLRLRNIQVSINAQDQELDLDEVPF